MDASPAAVIGDHQNSSMPTDNRLAGDTTISARAAQPPSGCPGAPAGVQTMAEVVAHINRPSRGVIPAATSAGNDVDFARQHEVHRLDQMLTDHRFAIEAIRLALATIDRYDPSTHRLTGQLSSYHQVFRAVAFDEYMRCPNVRSAASLLDVLISERAQ